MASCGAGGELGRLLVLAIHGHALAGKDVGEGAFVAKLAVALYEPGADLFLLAGLEDLVREGAGGARGARADLEKFAGDMREVFRWIRGREGEDERDGVKREAVGAYSLTRTFALGRAPSRDPSRADHAHAARVPRRLQVAGSFAA